MFATMVENEDLSLEDVEELKRRILEKEKAACMVGLLFMAFPAFKDFEDIIP